MNKEEVQISNSLRKYSTVKKQEQINDFFNSKCYAISGVSRDKNKFGHKVYEAFKEHGKIVLPINPNMEKIDDVNVYSSIAGLPDDVDAIVILNNRNRSQEIINQAIAKGIKNIWIQQKSDPIGFRTTSTDPIYNVITSECILMWMEPVKGFHKFHRFFKTFFSKN